MINVVSICCCHCWSVVNECENVGKVQRFFVMCSYLKRKAAHLLLQQLPQ